MTLAVVKIAAGISVVAWRAGAAAAIDVGLFAVHDTVHAAWGQAALFDDVAEHAVVALVVVEALDTVPLAVADRAAGFDTCGQRGLVGSTANMIGACGRRAARVRARAGARIIALVDGVTGLAPGASSYPGASAARIALVAGAAHSHVRGLSRGIEEATSHGRCYQA